jgi:hypothetical protein
MSDMTHAKTKREKRRKIPGWLIALMIAAALFLTGAICCNTIG